MPLMCINGNTSMILMDRNSDQVAALVPSGWPRGAWCASAHAQTKKKPLNGAGGGSCVRRTSEKVIDLIDYF